MIGLWRRWSLGHREFRYVPRYVYGVEFRYVRIVDLLGSFLCVLVVDKVLAVTVTVAATSTTPTMAALWVFFSGLPSFKP